MNLNLKTILIGVMAAVLLPITVQADDEKLPNVVLLFIDDLGYADTGPFGAKDIPTPHIDRLAKGGLQFTDGHCSAATCTPSRFSLLTGVLGYRHGVRILPPNARLTIPTDLERRLVVDPQVPAGAVERDGRSLLPGCPETPRTEQAVGAVPSRIRSSGTGSLIERPVGDEPWV